MAAQLKANARSLPESINMGIGGSATGLSIAVTIATLLATASTVSPAALILFAIPMLGIAAVYKGLSRKMTDGRSVDDAILRQISRPPLGLGSARRLDGVHAGRQRAVRHRDAEYSRSRFVAERRPDEAIGA
jgi:hypothetical protein